VDQQVSDVALWVGVISGIIGIALSVVAIVFSILVNNRSAEVSDKTIQSLQKIESTVERLSSDTGSLIKVAWEKMLGGVAGFSGAGDQSTPTQAAKGVLTEIRSGIPSLAENGDQSQPLTRADVDRLLRRVEARLRNAYQDQTSASGDNPITLTHMLNGLSPNGLALVAYLAGRGHLTSDQIEKIRAADPSVGEALQELTNSGVIMPLDGHGDDANKTVYWFAPWVARMIRPAVTMVRPPDTDVRRRVREALEKAGYV
jgi:hypothetical protein